MGLKFFFAFFQLNAPKADLRRMFKCEPFLSASRLAAAFLLAYAPRREANRPVVRKYFFMGQMALRETWRAGLDETRREARGQYLISVGSGTGRIARAGFDGIIGAATS